jgi:hypothetical protein
MSRTFSSRIDLGLALLSARRKPGEKFTHADIAAWCGCTPRYIGMVEQRALRKLRAAVRRGVESSLSEELSETAPPRTPTEMVMPVDPDTVEIPFKRWVMNHAGQEGVSASAIYMRLHRHPELRPPMRRVNARTLMVQLAA